MIWSYNCCSRYASCFWYCYVYNNCSLPQLIETRAVYRVFCAAPYHITSHEHAEQNVSITVYLHIIAELPLSLTAELSMCHYFLWHLYFVHLMSHMCSMFMRFSSTFLYFIFYRVSWFSLAIWFVAPIIPMRDVCTRLSALNQYYFCILNWKRNKTKTNLSVLRRQTFVHANVIAICILRAQLHIFANRIIYKIIMYANKSGKRCIYSCILGIPAAIESRLDHEFFNKAKRQYLVMANL